MNNKNEIETEKYSEIFSKILNIIWKKVFSEDELKVMEEKKWFSETIFEIINKNDNKRNRNLALLLISEVSSKFFEKFDHFHTDKLFVNLAISKDYTLFYGISNEMKKDLWIWFTTIKSMFHKWLNYEQISNFIEKYYPKNQDKCFEYYQTLLKKAEQFYGKDIWIIALKIKKSNSKLFEKLKSLWVFEEVKNKIKISSKFITDFINNLFKDENYLSKSEEEKYEIKQNMLLWLFWKKIEELDENELILFESILKLIFVEENKISQKELKKDSKKEKIKEEKTEESKNENELIEEDDDFEEFWKFCYPECEISSTSWWYFVNTISWKKVYFPEKIAKSFTTVAFTNFINFYNILSNIWLNFLWDKYRGNFLTLINNKIWIDYLNWEWITKWKILSILNLIWKNIWIPEKEILWNNWETIKEIKCFNRLWEAILQFEKIKKTWKINWDDYSDNWTFSKWAVEKKLILNDCINTKTWSLNIFNWK